MCRIDISVFQFLICFLFVQNLLGNVKILDSIRLKNPEIGLNTTEVIKLYNCSYEEYTVSTQNGYFIKIQRIIKEDKSDSPKHPVLLMHGLNCLSTVWVDNSNASLGFVLANHGYDVWLGNVRGNPYGKEHPTRKYTSKEFWDFSFHEHGIDDLPSIINCILRQTGFNQIYYIGHSMGSTELFVLLSTKPEYNFKIKAFIALAPVAYTSYALPQLKPLLNSFPFIKKSLAFFHQYAVIPNSDLHSFVVNYFCRNGEQSCEDVIHLMAGNDTLLLNTSRIPLFVSHCTVGTSLKTIDHYLQIRKSHNFSCYDYGSPKENREHYEVTDFPPLYNLSQVTAPVALFWSPHDVFTEVRDFEKLKRQLPNVILDYQVPYKNFTHLDFLWAMNSFELVYSKVIETMESLKITKNGRP